MSAQTISDDEFRREVEEAASVLRAHGFKQATQFESQTTTTSSVVYVGQNVAFTFTLDIRDQAIDLNVTRFRDGKLVPTWNGGYSSSLFSHLLKHCGFRGRSVPSPSLAPTAPKTKRAVSALMNLLAQPCSAKLLVDQPDALPH